MRKINTTTAGTKSVPEMEAPQAFREMANKATAQAGESYERMGAATAEASNVIQNACSTAARGAMNCNAKVIEFAHANSKAAFDYASELLGVKSPSEFLQVSTEQARKQFEVLSGQAKELTALSQQVMLEAAEPFRAGAAKAFRGPLA